MARAMMVAKEKMDNDPAFFSAKLITARFYADAVLPQAAAMVQSIRQAGVSTNRMPVDLF